MLVANRENKASPRTALSWYYSRLLLVHVEIEVWTKLENVVSINLRDKPELFLSISDLNKGNFYQEVSFNA